MSPAPTTATTTPINTGPAFVGPHVFSQLEQNTSARLQQNPTDLATQQDLLAAQEALKNARTLNVARLQWSQQVAWAPLQIVWPLRPSIETAVTEADVANFGIYNAQHQEDPVWNATNLVRKKGDPATGDESVNGAYQGALNSLMFFLDSLGINSLDNKGWVIKAAVHIGQAYNNAYYSEGSIHFGDGDGRIFQKFESDLSVVAHELGHGIVEMMLGGLTYWSQSGALNEHFADVLGISAMHYVLGQTSTPDALWLVGQGCMVPYTDKTGNRVHPALRSMKAPGTAYSNHPLIGTDPQPATMDNYYGGKDDNQGVHINSGIPNYAYYLAATAIGGAAKEVILPIWLAAVKTIGKNGTFKQFALATLAAAKKLYKNQPEVYEAISKAWTTVRVLGAQAIEVEPIYEIPDGDEGKAVIAALGMSPSEVTALQQSLLQTGITGLPGVQRAVVGFEFGEDDKARPVILAYADPTAPIRDALDKVRILPVGP